jgi:hypothetical protein
LAPLRRRRFKLTNDKTFADQLHGVVGLSGFAWVGGNNG